MTITCIRKARWVVAWDADLRQHYFRNDVDVVFDGNRIVHVDPAYAGKVDREIDGAGFCVMPGMVNVHTHLQSESIGRGLIEELGNQALYKTGILDEKSVFVTSGLTEEAGGAAAQLEANRASTQNAIAELLKSGCTTVTDLAVAWDGWLDTLADTGIRAVAAPMYRDAAGSCRPAIASTTSGTPRRAGATLPWRWRPPTAAVSHPSGRLGAMLAPMQVDTCSLELLPRQHRRRARARPQDDACTAAQHIPEFQEMVRRHGVTPVQWLHQGRAARARHAAGPRDLPRPSLAGAMVEQVAISIILAETGTSVAHCPVVFSRYGQMMEDVGSYIRKGVNVAIGTDTEPQNMAEEVRMASTLGRAAARGVRGVWLSELFHAATIGGAKALGRDDLGRLARRRQGRPGAARPRGARHAAGARSAAQLLLHRRRPRRAPRVRRRPAGREGRRGARPSTARQCRGCAAGRRRKPSSATRPMSTHRGRTADEISPTSFRIEGRN